MEGDQGRVGQGGLALIPRAAAGSFINIESGLRVFAARARLKDSANECLGPTLRQPIPVPDAHDDIT